MNRAINNNLPILSNEGGLSTYLEQIKKFPMLDAEEEYMLAKNWKTNGNVNFIGTINSDFFCFVIKLFKKKFVSLAILFNSFFILF